ncbi:MAG: hypothetical protein RIG26_16795 [Thalassospira sp.]|uniref:hypothetical protein n=1 Tax=Thalassospira TaxID=168934 RepID=UPI0032EC4563|tara:strand:- start:176 stop:619 length:444 start_codon:yes stop_codon:yes gene_type:complete
MMRLRQYLICAAAIAGLSLAGCSGTNLVGNTGSPNGDGKGGQPAPAFTQFTDIPMPSNSSLDMDRSIIFGASDAWHGRLVLNSGGSQAQMYDFYEREMPNFGWSKVTVVRADISVMVYDRENRVATIKLSGGSFAGSVVDVTVSPKG